MADIDGKDFPGQKDYSSRSSDLEPLSMYSSPIQASAHGDRSSSSAPAFGSALAETTPGGGLLVGISECTPSPVPKPIPQSESVSHPEQDSQPTEGDQIPPKKRKIFWCVIALSVLLAIVVSLLGVIVGEVRIVHWLPNRNELETNSELADLMPNDTILLYRGNSSSITISEVLPVSQKPDASLFVTECTELIQHAKNRSLTDRLLNFTGSSPVFIPTNPLHYERGSAIMFTITTVKATENSTLDLLIFDNVTKATMYSHNPNPETGAQATKHWEIDTKEGDNSTHIFVPSYGSYFIPVLSPVPSPILNIELSYMIKQVFYFHGDYAKYMNCSLSVEPCSLHFSTGNESCVLAYTPISSDEVTLQTYFVIGEKEYANDHLLLSQSLIGCILGAIFLVLIVVLICALTCICRKKKHYHHGGYDLVPTT